MNVARLVLSWLSLAVLVSGLAGCGGETKVLPKTVPASGSVTLNGSPVEGATVTLQPKAETAGAKPATGVSDASGNFSLTTFVSGADQAQGALPGDYSVTVTKVTSAAMTPEDMTKAMQSGKKIAPPKNLLPEKYSSAAKSGLTAAVGPEGNTALKFELQE
jgi:hypothetical protein